MDKLLLGIIFFIVVNTGCSGVRNTPIPDSLMYIKVVNIEEVYDSTDFEKFVGYKVASDTFPLKERATLLKILKQNNEAFIVGTDSCVYLPKSAVYNMETILFLNDEISRRITRRDSVK